jgi:flagellar motor switch protein FliN/FliY
MTATTDAMPAAGGAPMSSPAEVHAKVADFAQLSPPTGDVSGASFDFFLDVPVTITVKLGEAVMPINEVMKVGVGAVIELDRDVNQPVELSVRGVPFARGEVVVVDEHFGVRIKELLSPRGRGGVK